MKPGENSKKRYDISLSSDGEDKLLFHEQGVETVSRFVSGYLLEKINTTWWDNRGLQSLSGFWDERNVFRKLGRKYEGIAPDTGW